MQTIPIENFPSPYPELLFSNTVPLDSQIPVILSAIQTAQEDIRATENKIGELGEELVNQRRSTLQEFIQMQKSMVSTLRRLPSEILSEIFMHCSSKQDGCKPRIFAAVCSRWRDVSLATPRLWCHVYLREQMIAPQSLHSLLSLQLERSGQAPLSVMFSDSYDKTSTIILKLLLTVSDRWQSLDLELTYQQHECLRIHSSASHFPILKRLAILVTPSWELGNLSRPLPLLEGLTLNGDCPIPSKLPWTNFTKCTLIHCSPPEVLNILRSSSTIAELTLFQCVGPGEQEPKQTPISSSIRSLNILECKGAFTRDFLGSLTAPKLQALRIEDCEDTRMNVHLISLLTGSSGPITHLSLCGVRVPEHDLIALLKFADTVNHLEISWPWDVHSHALMEALTILPSNRYHPRLLPRLRVLTITGGLSCSNDSLLMMLQSRCPGLERVELFYAGRAFFFDRSLDVLRKAGMEITVRLDGPIDPLPVKVEDFEYAVWAQYDS
ncbi:hypothetical protein FB451DRAFT_1089698 [Mycena latifolia]|nr:hypothetical protein FB451DRAFT_1089698 [Mycena latifolia]